MISILDNESGKLYMLVHSDDTDKVAEIVDDVKRLFPGDYTTEDLVRALDCNDISYTTAQTIDEVLF